MVLPQGARPAERADPRPRLVMAGRHDSFVPFMEQALAERFVVVGQVDAELSQAQRLMTAVVTFRPSRRAWVERFYKSGLAVRLRSRNARRALARVGMPYDVVLQTHALFELHDPRVVLYLDCTHRQSAQQWPDWNPLSGPALERWYSRERHQYRSAAHVFAFSEETRGSLVEDYGVDASRVTVVGAGLNFDEVPAVPEPPAAGPLATEPARSGSPTVLFVGNDFVRKGGEQLLAAFRLVRDVVPDARLRIVGTPHPIAAQPGVEVVGRLGSRSEMAVSYSAAQVFCMPSTFEPYGFALLEAMAHGLPCVSTSTCGVAEVIEDGVTGVLVVRNAPQSGKDVTAGGTVDVPALAAALVDLLTHPEKATLMGVAGRDRVMDSLLWSHVVSRMAHAISSEMTAA